MSGPYGERTVREFSHPNYFGQPRTVQLRVNYHGRWTWWICYPELPEAYPTQSPNYFDSEAAARRSARRCLKSLAQ